MIDAVSLFEKYGGDIKRYGEKSVQYSARKDLQALILLDKICPSRRDIIACAEHDEIYLSITIEELNRNATEEQIIELCNLGVMYMSNQDSLMMLV